MEFNYIIEKIKTNNLNVGAQFIEKNSEEFIVRSVGLASEIEDVKNIILKSESGIPIFLNQVADVELCNQPIGYQLTGFTTGGTWSGSGITSGGEFTPNGEGDFDVVYTLTDDNGCTNEDLVTISVKTIIQG